MTDRDTEDDPLSRLYRERSAEQPPAAVDRAILDHARQAAHRSADARAASPGHGVRRWSGLAAAAVVVLAVAVLLRVPDPVPDLESAALPAPERDRSARDADAPRRGR